MLFYFLCFLMLYIKWLVRYIFIILVSIKIFVGVYIKVGIFSRSRAGFFLYSVLKVDYLVRLKVIGSNSVIVISFFEFKYFSLCVDIVVNVDYR